MYELISSYKSVILYNKNLFNIKKLIIKGKLYKKNIFLSQCKSLHNLSAKRKITMIVISIEKSGSKRQKREEYINEAL